MKKTLLALSLAAVLPLQALAADATVYLDPQNSVIDLDSGVSTLTVNLVGTYDGSGSLLGGAVNLSFDPSVLQVVSVELTAPHTVGGYAGLLDNASGTIAGIGFADFTGVSAGNYSFASVTFQGIAAGVAALSVTDANDPVYAWANDVFVGDFPEVVNFTGSTGQVVVTAVPEPESFAMLLAGLGVLAGAARRRTVRV